VTDLPGTRERLAAFGRWLARERELRGLARDEVVRETKLAPGVIEALESGEEGRIPPRAYAIGYLRAYAAAVGLAADEVVLRFEEALGPAQTSGPRRSPPVWARIAAIVLAAAAAVAGWALFRP
jgi:cytoskeletal protein RodZ